MSKGFSLLLLFIFFSPVNSFGNAGVCEEQNIETVKQYLDDKTEFKKIEYYSPENIELIKLASKRYKIVGVKNTTKLCPKSKSLASYFQCLCNEQVKKKKEITGYEKKLNSFFKKNKKDDESLPDFMKRVFISASADDEDLSLEDFQKKLRKKISEMNGGEDEVANTFFNLFNSNEFISAVNEDLDEIYERADSEKTKVVEDEVSKLKKIPLQASTDPSNSENSSKGPLGSSGQLKVVSCEKTEDTNKKCKCKGVGKTVENKDVCEKKIIKLRKKRDEKILKSCQELVEKSSETKPSDQKRCIKACRSKRRNHSVIKEICQHEKVISAIKKTDDKTRGRDQEFIGGDRGKRYGTTTDSQSEKELIDQKIIKSCSEIILKKNREIKINEGFREKDLRACAKLTGLEEVSRPLYDLYKGIESNNLKQVHEILINAYHVKLNKQSCRFSGLPLLNKESGTCKNAPTAKMKNWKCKNDQKLGGTNALIAKTQLIASELFLLIDNYKSERKASKKDRILVQINQLLLHNPILMNGLKKESVDTTISGDVSDVNRLLQRPEITVENNWPPFLKQLKKSLQSNKVKFQKPFVREFKKAQRNLRGDYSAIFDRVCEGESVGAGLNFLLDDKSTVDKVKKTFMGNLDDTLACLTQKFDQSDYKELGCIAMSFKFPILSPGCLAYSFYKHGEKIGKNMRAKSFQRLCKEVGDTICLHGDYEKSKENLDESFDDYELEVLLTVTELMPLIGVIRKLSPTARNEAISKIAKLKYQKGKQGLAQDEVEAVVKDVGKKDLAKPKVAKAKPKPKKVQTGGKESVESISLKDKYPDIPKRSLDNLEENFPCVSTLGDGRDCLAKEALDFFNKNKESFSTGYAQNKQFLEDLGEIAKAGRLNDFKKACLSKPEDCKRRYDQINELEKIENPSALENFFIDQTKFCKTKNFNEGLCKKFFGDRKFTPTSKDNCEPKKNLYVCLSRAFKRAKEERRSIDRDSRDLYDFFLESETNNVVSKLNDSNFSKFDLPTFKARFDITKSDLENFDPEGIRKWGIWDNLPDVSGSRLLPVLPPGSKHQKIDIGKLENKRNSTRLIYNPVDKTVWVTADHYKSARFVGCNPKPCARGLIEEIKEQCSALRCEVP